VSPHSLLEACAIDSSSAIPKLYFLVRLQTEFLSYFLDVFFVIHKLPEVLNFAASDPPLVGLSDV
jgi:hypothetical protein